MEEEEKKEEEKKKFKITELYTNKQYYAIANLVFYSILIIGLIIFVRLSPESNNETNKTINTKSNIVGFDNIKSKNFEFKYTYLIDGVEDVYEGKQYNDSVSFTDGKKAYFYEGDLFFEKEEDKYILSDFFPIHFNFFNVDLVEKLITNSVKSGETYQINYADFSRLTSDSSVNQETNKKIYIKLNKSNNIINEIVFDLTEVRDNNTNETITLSYYNFNLVEEFSIKTVK